MSENKTVSGLKTGFASPRNRIILAVTAIVLVAVIAIGVSGSKKPTVIPEQVTTAKPPSEMQFVPGQEDSSAKYRELQQMANTEEGKEALAKGEAFVPTIVNTQTVPTQTPLAPQATPAPQPAPVPVGPQPVQSKRESAKPSKFVASLLEAWAPVKQAPVSLETESAQRASGTQAAAATSSTAAAKTETKFLAYAGDIWYAVLETDINSDEPGPVLATIATGPNTGARLIGAMKTNKESVSIEFQLAANLPGKRAGTKIAAVAVDPSTARPNLATDVDHHYLAKYGLILASAFVSGYADAVSRQNTVTTTSALGGSTTVEGPLDPKERTLVALGKAGGAAGDEIMKSSDFKTTIKVASGTPIGVLFLDDVKEETQPQEVASK